MKIITYSYNICFSHHILQNVNGQIVHPGIEVRILLVSYNLSQTSLPNGQQIVLILSPKYCYICPLLLSPYLLSQAQALTVSQLDYSNIFRQGQIIFNHQICYYDLHSFASTYFLLLGIFSPVTPIPTSYLLDELLVIVQNPVQTVPFTLNTS